MIVRCIYLIIAFFLSSLVAAQNSTLFKNYTTTEPAQNSVLASGKWFKIKINQSGIYRLAYEDIVNMGFSDPGQVKIFGNGGRMLPLMNNVPRYDDLIENTIYMNKGSDEIFNQGDYILFYGQGPVAWNFNTSNSMFEHQVNLYSEAAYYFVTTDVGEGLKVTSAEAISGTPATEITTFDDYSYREKNKYNLLESGRQWLGDKIDYSPFDSTFNFTNLVTTSPVKVKLQVVSRSDKIKNFSLYHDSLVGTVSVQKIEDLTNKTGIQAYQSSAIINFPSSSDQVNLIITYNKTGSEDQGYIDFMTLNTRRKLTLVNDALFFRDRTIAGTGVVARYTIDNCNAQTQIWDITDPFRIKRIPAELSLNKLSFSDSANMLKEYVALNPGAAFPKPMITPNSVDIGVVLNQDLHGIGPYTMLIVSNPLFIEAADSIAEFHRQHDNMSVFVATTEQIFNEFSSGATDVSAIRDFARLIYNSATGEHNILKYLLLIGDGSYNNILRSTGNPNFIPTYQSANSLNAAFSYVSDDFFGLMDENEGGHEFMENYSLDLGVGRLPVKTEEEAISLYRKIKNYNTYKNKGDWQNNILFAADDQDYNLHMKQANGLADWVDNNHPQYAIKKVLIDAYPQASTSIGTRYPDAKRIITSNIEKGLLIFNYTGHGGENGLADEEILMREDIEQLTNLHKLPLFITATCEFSRFDDLTNEEDGTLIERTSAGELSILNPNGGSIALITTTRIVYSSENHELNTRFYQFALARDPDGNLYTLGDVMKMTKNILGDSRNKLNFILLGDPALKLAIPGHTVVTDSINHVAVSDPIDTLKAFSRIVVTGHIENDEYQFMDNFNGLVYPSVFDKKKTITTLANDQFTSPMQFTTREDLLFKGKASVTNGRFSFEFLVPRDITYNYGNGRIIYYSYNQDIDANGEFSGFIIGGTDTSTEIDMEGPDISLYLNDEYFNNQGITNTNPVIYAKIQDESGINTIGNGIGHDITGVVDEIVTDPVVMNDYFESDLDNYTSGTLSYPMVNLSEGVHTLRLKVWDVYNNSSEQTIEFRVISDGRIIISKAGNYPNPARDHTAFSFEHNKAGEELKVTITVYDMEGRLVSSFEDMIIASGFNSTLSEWDLTDTNGNMLKQGIYPYRIRLSDSNGLYTDSYQKLVVIR